MTASESEPDLARVTISTELAPGERLTMVKLMAYGWSSGRSMPALRDQVDAALAAAMRSGWKGLVDGQRAYLDDVWDRADIELDGDPQLQQAVRFGLFQVLQAAARAEGSAIPGQGPHRPRLRRAHVLGPGVLRAAGAHLQPPRGRARRAALAPCHARQGGRPSP